MRWIEQHDNEFNEMLKRMWHWAGEGKRDIWGSNKNMKDF